MHGRSGTFHCEVSDTFRDRKPFFILNDFLLLLLYNICMALEEEFWKKKKLEQMNQEEWEALCDGCGLCCFRKFITGRKKNTRIHFTRIACDFLDLKTFRCTEYENRFKLCKECTRLTKKNVTEFSWLPQTCAYRLLYENKNLPEWHPLVSKKNCSVKESGILIKNAVHEKDAADWEDYEIK